MTVSENGAEPGVTLDELVVGVAASVPADADGSEARASDPFAIDSETMQIRTHDASAARYRTSVDVGALLCIIGCYRVVAT